MTRRAGRLNPSLLDRILRAASPGWFRTVTARRALACALVLIAAVFVAFDGRTQQVPPILVAVRDLTPNDTLTADDVAGMPIPAELAPPDPPGMVDIVGHRVTGPMRAGEPFARHRLLNPRLPAELTGDPTARLVPVRPADDAAITFIRAGDRVDLLSSDAAVLVRGAIVAMTAEPGKTPAPGAGRTVLMAMSERAAHRVAAVALHDAVTFVLH